MLSCWRPQGLCTLRPTTPPTPLTPAVLTVMGPCPTMTYQRSASSNASCFLFCTTARPKLNELLRNWRIVESLQFWRASVESLQFQRTNLKCFVQAHSSAPLQRLHPVVPIYIFMKVSGTTTMPAQSHLPKWRKKPQFREQLLAMPTFLWLAWVFEEAPGPGQKECTQANFLRRPAALLNSKVCVCVSCYDVASVLPTCMHQHVCVMHQYVHQIEGDREREREKEKKNTHTHPKKKRAKRVKKT